MGRTRGQWGDSWDKDNHEGVPRHFKAGRSLLSILPRSCPPSTIIAEEISSIDIAAASPSATDGEYLCEEDARADYLCRFDSSAVSMLNEETPMARRSSLRAAQGSMPCTHLGSTPSKTRSLSPSFTLNAHSPRSCEHSGHF